MTLPKDSDSNEFLSALLEDARIKKVEIQDDDGDLVPAVQLVYGEYIKVIGKLEHSK